MLIFVLSATRDLGTAVARALNVELAPHEEREFEDGVLGPMRVFGCFTAAAGQA
jgi:hypothetical protein